MSNYYDHDSSLHGILQWRRVSPGSSQLIIWHDEWVRNRNFYYDFIFTIMLGLKSYCVYCDEEEDYITEAENKHGKGHLGPGVGIIAHWIKASRYYKMFEQNHYSVLKKVSLKDPNLQQSSIFKFDHKVQMLPWLICDWGILANHYEEIQLLEKIII